MTDRPDVTSLLDTIRRLYFGTTPATIAGDLARAVELLKSLPDEDTRQRAAVYMEGLAEMRKEWAGRRAGERRRGRRESREP
jgi:hypothetical protein